MNKSSFDWKEKSGQILITMNIIILFIILLTIISSVSLVTAIPQGPVIIYNKTDNATPLPAVQITTAGGSFTTMVLNATTQTPRWKAYVGNVTGKLTLADSNGKSIFDWRLASVTGKVYATRNSTIDWSTIGCADSTSILNEDAYLNMSQNNPDTINRTFSNKVHKSFYVGTICQSIATYVNGTVQASSENSVFQEMVLKDGLSRMVYTTLINQNTTGYNNQKFDFQMIVPENEYQSVPTTYYMYAELI